MSTIMQINPFDFLTDLNGDALDEGYVWFGSPNQDPRQFPISIFYDAALTIPAAQPLRTNSGYITKNNAPVFLFGTGNYSVLIEDKKHRQIYYVPDFLFIGANSAAAAKDVARVVINIADLRNLTAATGYKSARTKGYYLSGDGGDGFYYLDAADITTPDNGGSVIVSTDNSRWKLLAGGHYDVKQFGAKADWNGSTGTDNSPFIQACINSAKTDRKDVFLSPGDYATQAPVFIDNSTSTSFLDPKKIDFFGAGINVSRMFFRGLTGAALSLVGGMIAGALPMQCPQKLYSFGLSGTLANGTYGLYLDTAQQIYVDDVETTAFDFGINMLDVDFLLFNKVITHFNNHGLYMQQRAPRLVNSTAPNGLVFVGCHIGGNSLYGAHFLKGACVNFYGGDVEGNGFSNGTNGWGLRFEDCGVQGGVGANLNGVYFEQNQGVADVWILALNPPDPGLNPNHCVHLIQASSFNRVTSTNFVANNIIASLQSSNSGKQKVVIRDSSFKGYGTYIPSGARPYIGYPIDARNSYNCLIEGCVMQDDVESVPQNDYYNCSLTLLAPQVVNTALATNINWTVEQYDSDAMHIIGGPIVTIPAPGKYLVTASVYWAANAVGVRSCLLFKNGAEVGGDTRNAATGGARTRQNISLELLLAKGDQISLLGFQDSGGNLNADIDGTRLSVRYLPN